MFTGIIEATAPILQIGGGTLVLSRPAMFDDLKIGCSIAVSGVCLSVTAFDGQSMSFDVVETTLKKTKLGSLKKGGTVNLERALRADGRLEGHIVLGHVEGVAEVTSVTDAGFSVRVPDHLSNYVVHHGSVTIDGVALTIADLKGSELTVAVIPLTYRETTLGSLKKGDSVNLETDVVGKYILRAHGA